MGEDVADWDIITLSGLRASGSHGVYDFERAGHQDFVADITLYVDASTASKTDDVADTVDYSRVAEDAVAVLTGPSVYLIETLASQLAEVALSYPGVHRAQVTVHKPMAPLKQNFTDVSVTVIRERRGSFNEQPGGSGAPVVRRRAVIATHPAPEDPTGGGHSEGRSVLEPQPSTPTPSPAPLQTTPPRLTAEVPPQTKRSPQTSGKHLRTDAQPRFSRANPRRSTVVYDVVLALGANRGDVVANLRGAVERLAVLDGFEVLSVSPLVRTEPVLEPGALPQDDYLNAVVLGRTVLAPPALLAATQKIEADFGRERKTRWGARTLDIDIIDLDQMRLDTRNLTVPHPRAAQRAFVLYPWSLVDPDGRVPGIGQVRDLLPNASDLSGVLAEYPNWLEGDGAGGPGEEVELHLAPRPERKREIRQGPARHVVLRGEPVTLEPIDQDPIFEELLIKEARRAGQVPRTHAQMSPRLVTPPPRPPRPRRAAVSLPPGREVEESVAAQPERPKQATPVHLDEQAAQTQPHRSPSIPRSHRRRAASEQRGSEPAPHSPQLAEPLPEWDFRGSSSASVRVVDSLEGPPAQPASIPPRTTQVPRVARGVTVRPTLTGSVPLVRPRQSAN